MIIRASAHAVLTVCLTLVLIACGSSPTAVEPSNATPTPELLAPQEMSTGLAHVNAEIPPCTPVSGSSVDPCEVGSSLFNATPGSVSRLVVEPPPAPYSVSDFLDGFGWHDFGIGHIVVRGSYLPSTVRCTSGNSFLEPSHMLTPGFTLDNSLYIECYADMRVNAYIIGTGPSVLTAIVAFEKYGERGQPYYEETEIEALRAVWERALTEGGRQVHRPYPHIVTGPPGGIAGREAMLFLGPSSDASIEAWEVYAIWDVQRKEGGTVVARHPDWHYYYHQHNNFEQLRPQLEMGLPTFKTAVTTAHNTRVTTNGGRVRPGTNYPKLVTDATKLNAYFREVGAYDDPSDPPVKPPPPCGLAVPNQADNPALMRDCYALLEAKDALRGTASLNWSVNTTIAQWDGVTVGGTPKRVTKLLLANKSLNGTIPWALERLGKLAELRLSGNALTGCIPVALKDVATHDLASVGLSYCAVKFGASTYDAPEGAITSVTLQLDRALERSVSVPVTATAVTAESTDYLISGVSNGAVTIPAGSSSATFGVNAHRDADCLDETLHLSFGTLPAGLATGTPSQAVVTIKDDDACPSVLFDAASHTVFEGTSHVFQVQLSTSANERRSVPVTITNGTAESGDYTVTGVTNGAVTFPGGRTYVRVTIAANQDADCDDETVTFGLGTLTDGLTAGTPSTLTVTLDDDDTGTGCTPVKFSALAYSGKDGLPSTVTVQLSRAASASVTIPVTVTPATGYTVSGLTNGSLTFAAGETSKTFTITGAYDDDCDGKTLQLGFGTLPAGVSRGLNPAATLTIADEDVCRT